MDFFFSVTSVKMINRTLRKEKLDLKAPGPVPDRIDQIICDHTYNKKVPSQDGEIVLKVLEPQLHDQLKSPYSDEVRKIKKKQNEQKSRPFNGHFNKRQAREGEGHSLDLYCIVNPYEHDRSNR